MWLFTRFGFFSAVCAREGDGKKSRKVDSDRMMIRARDKQHLENLRDAFPCLANTEIHVSAGSDYLCRMFIDKTVWIGVVCELVAEQDYDNFKNVVAKTDCVDGAYLHALHSVWSVGMRLQETKHHVSYAGRKVSTDEATRLSSRVVRDEAMHSFWGAELRKFTRGEARQQIVEALREANCPGKRLQHEADALLNEIFATKQTG